jgi:hypothetical protein
MSGNRAPETLEFIDRHSTHTGEPFLKVGYSRENPNFQQPASAIGEIAAAFFRRRALAAIPPTAFAKPFRDHLPICSSSRVLRSERLP